MCGCEWFTEFYFLVLAEDNVFNWLVGTLIQSGACRVLDFFGFCCSGGCGLRAKNCVLAALLSIIVKL